MKQFKWFWVSVFCLVATFVLQGCKPEAAKPAVASTYHDQWPAALQFMSEDLAAQIEKADLDLPKNVPVDLFFDEKSAEEVASAKNLQQQVIAAMAKRFSAAKFESVSTRSIQSAEWVLLTSYAHVKTEEAGKPGGWVRLRMAVADIKTGTALAMAATYLDARQFRGAPSRFYKDAPMYLADSVHLDRTAVMAGKKRSLTDTLTLRAKIGDAVDVYEMGRYPEAERMFKSILETMPMHTGALSGLYQALWLQKKTSEAEKVFERLVSAGLGAGKVSVKLLFRLGSTEFVDDGDLAQQYSMWIKVLAKQIVEKNLCLDVVGHASASGSLEYNNRLSLSRASAIISRMQQGARASGVRLKAIGKGAAETIVGTGTNDASDAIDRRVEFAVQACQ